MRILTLLSFLSVFLLVSCKQEATNTLFKLKKNTTLSFENNLVYTEDFNPYTYRNFFNGGGVAIGDINNDGLMDVYFTGNLVDNKLYLNQGDWQFKDITATAGVACSNIWSSGANFVDINGDGLLDIYVCKAGKPGGENRHNELFINQGDLTFVESSKKYGLNIEGLSIQSAFFDYDRDGDLDCYLLNNSIRSVGGFDLVKDLRTIPASDGNMFLENRGDHFVDVSQEAGIYTSAIGFGLGITLSDFNKDGWTDIYISNDFFEKDYLYLNNKNKTFAEVGDDYFESLPMGAMGADVADLDNDTRPDLMITEMLPGTLERKKTKATYESWRKYSLAVSKGYSHQMPRNMLQKNMGESGFLEVGRSAGVAATNWSWSCLLQDFDNDGLKDIIVANGIYKDLLDRDYLTFVANDIKIKNMINSGENAIMNLIDAMPSEAVPNYAFRNKGDFLFADETIAWGLGEPSFSNGSAYGDLDNDGDLDLIINNVNMPSFIYENTTSSQEKNYLNLKLTGQKKNTKAIGAKVIAYACDQTFMNEQFPSRGFQSSIGNDIWIGLGSCDLVDSLKIIWPDGTADLILKPVINSTLNYNYGQAKTNTILPIANAQKIFTLADTLGFTHREIKFNQFDRERLLYKMNTGKGPAITVADLNNDGQSDIFVGGGKAQNSTLFLSNKNGFTKITTPFEKRARPEVVAAHFFDSDNDGDQDLYVAYGGTAFASYAVELNDDLYLNDGKGNLVAQPKTFKFPQPVATGAVAIADYNGDGKMDVFVGNRNSINAYGSPGSGYLFENRGDNKFTLLDLPIFENLGMITSVAWLDLDGDERQDLLITGEWMSLRLFKNNSDGFTEVTKEYGLEKTQGIWNNLLVKDFNGDGKMDIFAGNAGTNGSLNSRHKLYLADFDKNGQIDPILCETIDGKDYPVLDMDEIVSQLPMLKKKFLYYKEYAKATMEDLFGASELKQAKVLKLNTVETTLFFRSGDQFVKGTLPSVAQYASVHAAASKDFDNDGLMDLVIGGNHYAVKPQFGRDDASRGWWMKGKKIADGFTFEKGETLNWNGQIRSLTLLKDQQLLVGSNNEPVLIYEFINN